jgi:hypothetical protein
MDEEGPQVSSSFTDIANSLRSTFYDAWVALANDVPCAIDNDESFNEPIDANGDPLPWIRVSVRPALVDQLSMGATTGGTYLHDGFFEVEIFDSLGNGMGVLNQLADSAADILRGQTFDDVILDAPRLFSVGGIDKTYYKYLLSTSYRSFKVPA